MQKSPEQRLAEGEEIKLETGVPLELTPELSPLKISTRATMTIEDRRVENAELALGVLEYLGEGKWKWNSPIETIGDTLTADVGASHVRQNVDTKQGCFQESLLAYRIWLNSRDRGPYEQEWNLGGVPAEDYLITFPFKYTATSFCVCRRKGAPSTITV